MHLRGVDRVLLLLPGHELIIVAEKHRASLEFEQPLGRQRQGVAELSFQGPTVGAFIDEPGFLVLAGRGYYLQARSENRLGIGTKGQELLDGH